MELIPIIQNILLLVVVLAIITIIVSYRAHNAKQKKAISEPSEGKASSPIKQPDIMVNKVYKKITKEDFSQRDRKDKSQEKNIHQQNKKIQLIPEVNKKNIHQAKPNNTIKNERIEIVNNIATPSKQTAQHVKEKKETPPLQKTSTEVNKLHTLSDKIIDKYDDESNDVIYTLNIKKSGEKEDQA